MTSTTTASLHVLFESATTRQDIPSDQYRQLLRELNAKQREIVSLQLVQKGNHSIEGGQTS